MSKCLHKVFKVIVNVISQLLPILGESGSEVFFLVLDPRNFTEVTRLSEDINKPWVKENLKDIKSIINYQTFLVQYPDRGEPVTTCMYVYKAKIQCDRSLEKLKLIVVVIGDLQHGTIWRHLVTNILHEEFESLLCRCS